MPMTKQEDVRKRAGGTPVDRQFPTLLPKSEKPTRADLLLVIERLQGLIGQAVSASQNDRAPDRADRIAAALKPAFELCVAARSFDPAPRIRGKRPNLEESR